MWLAVTSLSSGCAGLPGPAPDPLREADRAYAERDEGGAPLVHLYLNAVFRHSPDDPEALWRRARLEVWQGRVETAWSTARRAVRLAPDHAEVATWAGYAGALSLAARPIGRRLAGAPEVQADLERALSLDPGAARAHVGLAVLSLALEEEPTGLPIDRPDPLLHLMTARELRPGLPEVHLLLARVLLARSDPGGAITALRSLLADPPEARYGPRFPDAQIAEWRTASLQARLLLTRLGQP